MNNSFTGLNFLEDPEEELLGVVSNTGVLLGDNLVTSLGGMWFLPAILMIMSTNTMGVVNTVFDVSSILRKSYLGRASPAKPVSRSHFHAYDSKCEKVVSIAVCTFH